MFEGALVLKNGTLLRLVITPSPRRISKYATVLTHTMTASTYLIFLRILTQSESQYT